MPEMPKVASNLVSTGGEPFLLIFWFLSFSLFEPFKNGIRGWSGRELAPAQGLPCHEAIECNRLLKQQESNT